MAKGKDKKASDENKEVTENQTAPQATVEGGDKPQAEQRPSVVIQTQYVKDLSFENPNAPQSLMVSDAQPQFNLSLNVNANTLNEDRHYEVILNIRATAKRQDKDMFIAELSYAALVSVDKGVKEDMVQPLLLIEIPRMLFPFARQILSETTQAGGFMPLNIQPVDFRQYYRANQQTSNPKVEEKTA